MWTKIGIAMISTLVVIYFKYLLTPPADVVGSYLTDSEDRTRILIRAARNQGYTKGDHLFI